jgi:competence protein ComFC
MHRLAKVANDAVRILFEPGCAGCGQLLDAPLRCAVCDNCWNQFEPVAAPYCQTCGDELAGFKGPRVRGSEGSDEPGIFNRCDRCTSNPPAFSLARSASRYDGPPREIIHAFKYEGRRLLAEPLGDVLRRAGDDHDLFAGVDAVVPVPLHLIRSLRRGFNQADDLARQLRLPVWRALSRRTHGPSQMRLPAEARRRNLESHFSLRPTALAFGGRSLKGASLVLIDDVMTTGATLEGCARVLRAAGAADVRALTVARTVVARPPRPIAPPHLSLLRH